MARYLLLAIFLVLYAAFTRWTWRRLWRHAQSPWEQLVYGRGVRGFGLFMWLALGIILPAMRVNRDGEPLSSTATLVAVAIGLVVYFPLGLWSGYFWGRQMAAELGVPERK